MIPEELSGVSIRKLNVVEALELVQVALPSTTVPAKIITQPRKALYPRAVLGCGDAAALLLSYISPGAASATTDQGMKAICCHLPICQQHPWQLLRCPRAAKALGEHGALLWCLSKGSVQLSLIGRTDALELSQEL